MVVMGNPPYSVSSSNKGEWIESLTADYKKDLNERNIQPLSDDYIKFIRFGQHFIDKNGEGILAYITNNSFIDGLIHRQMRKQLLKSFDKIYILDLHGNSSRKEKDIDGTKDENVFDIRQGVSINIFVKSKANNEINGQVFHYDLYGKRERKYDFLNKNNLLSISWNLLENLDENYFFVKKDFELSTQYNQFFSVGELFETNITGIKTHKDAELVSFEKFPSADNYKYDYRPFDLRYINYDLKKVVRHRFSVMRHMLFENLSLVIPRQAVTENWNHVQITKNLSDNRIHYSNKGIPIVCPLYLYPETKEGETALIAGHQRTPNLNEEVVSKIAGNLRLEYTFEKEDLPGTFAPIDLLDYIYAILHSPSYREKYKEFLKIDFPRIPYPSDVETFWQLVALGRELREIHLLESPVVENYITGYPMDGDNVVTRKITTASPGYEPLSETHGRVWINEQQYFDKLPLAAWEFYIGGYQPAQKWLKDRRDRELSYEDILHYQKIIVALAETGRIMGQIEKLEVGSPKTEGKSSAQTLTGL